MGLFTRKTSIKPEGNTYHQQASRIEVTVNKNAAKEAVDMAKDASNKLNNILEENGFTLKIYLAAGGKMNKGQNK